MAEANTTLSRPASSSSLASSALSTLSSSEAEEFQPFPFFALPFELRDHIFSYLLVFPDTIDIDFNARSTRHALSARTLARMSLVSKRFHEESALVFFGKNTFRLFPTHPLAAAKRAQPLIRALPARHRRLITRMELRLGPFWTNPPACWKVDVRLGLKDLVRVRRLDVFVECDPSQSMFAGFRKSETFYTVFSGKLLEALLKRMPALKEVRFDGYKSVLAMGPLVQALVDVVQRKGKGVAWGAGLGFERFNKDIELDMGLISSGLDTLNLQLLAPHA